VVLVEGRALQATTKIKYGKRLLCRFLETWVELMWCHVSTKVHNSYTIVMHKSGLIKSRKINNESNLNLKKNKT
jgi:hypothetical protein